MARRLTDTYFVKYSMVVVRMHINSEDREDEVVESNGSGIFIIDQYESVSSSIQKSLEASLRAQYYHSDILPYIRSLTYTEITPL